MRARSHDGLACPRAARALCTATSGHTSTRSTALTTALYAPLPAVDRDLWSAMPGPKADQYVLKAARLVRCAPRPASRASAACRPGLRQHSRGLAPRRCRRPQVPDHRIWRLHRLGSQQQRSQHFGALAVVRVLAAVLASAARLHIDEAGRRFRDLVGRGRRCWRRVIGRSLGGSCAPPPQAF
jgi:hypothetical protein